MTVKRRLFWSNILMIFVPVGATMLIGLLCVGFIWLSLIHGAGLGLNEQEDFDRACIALSEVIEGRLEHHAKLSTLEDLLNSNGMTVSVRQNGQDFYHYGEMQKDDKALISAANFLDYNATVTQNGRSLYARQRAINAKVYQILIFGGNAAEQTYGSIKAALALPVIVIAFTIFLSIMLTNRFLSKFVFRKIEKPLNILTNGVHELRDGNLNYRIAYDGKDEFLPVCQDFNEMAQTLKDLVNRLQQQEISRKELIAGISHDIRSPLTSIQAYVEGLIDGVAKTLESKNRYLQTIKTKAEDLERIVAALFFYSKMELGEYQDDFQMLWLDRTIADTVSPLQEEYRQKGLAISIDLEPVKLYADPVQIARIVTNILENSLKYNDKEQGHLEISLRKTAAGSRLAFADDGPGVADDELPRLFEPFYRSDPARQNPNKGSGLGLAIVAGIVEHIGGSVYARHCALGGLEICIDFFSEERNHGEDTDCGG